MPLRESPSPQHCLPQGPPAWTPGRGPDSGPLGVTQGRLPLEPSSYQEYRETPAPCVQMLEVTHQAAQP